MHFLVLYRLILQFNSQRIFFIIIVFVSSVCQNKYHTLGWLPLEKNKLLTVPEAGSPRSRGQLIHFPGAGSLPGVQMVAFLLCPHMAGRGGGRLSGVSSYKGTNPITRTPPSRAPDTQVPPEGSVSKYQDIMGLGPQHMNLGGMKFSP